MPTPGPHAFHLQRLQVTGVSPAAVAAVCHHVPTEFPVMAAPDPTRTSHAPPDPGGPRVTFPPPDAPFPAGDNFTVVGRVRSSARTLARLAPPPADPWDVRFGLGPDAAPVPAARPPRSTPTPSDAPDARPPRHPHRLQAGGPHQL